MKQDNNKIITFIKREDSYISKYKFKPNKNGKIDFKVIPYPKYKKILRKGGKFIKFKKLYIFFLIILIACAYFFINTNIIEKKESNSIKISNSRVVSNDYFNMYCDLIENNIKKLANFSYDYYINTQYMHKNNSYLYAYGTISSKEKGDLYFDIILKNNKPYSLIIDNIEYIKR